MCGQFPQNKLFVAILSIGYALYGLPLFTVPIN